MIGAETRKGMRHGGSCRRIDGYRKCAVAEIPFPFNNVLPCRKNGLVGKIDRIPEAGGS